MISRTLLLCVVLAVAGTPTLYAADASPMSDGDSMVGIEIFNARVPLTGVLTGGQPTEAQLREAARAGYRTVINLRTAKENGLAGEPELVEDLGMRYVHIPVAGPGDYNEENVRRIAALLDDPGAKPILFHCRSARRVGVMLAVKAAMIDDASMEQALDLGHAAGAIELDEAALTALLPAN